MPTVITKPKVHISPELLDQIKSQTEEVGQVVLHFIVMNPTPFPMGIRIWPTTFLYDNGSDHVSEMVHVEKIVMAPEWQEVACFAETYFTLIFSGLPKGCASFDFVEECQSEGVTPSQRFGGQREFVCRGIERNDTDVYYLAMR